MPWVILLASAVLEAVWATALGASEGLSRPSPTVVFLVALAASMVGLAVASESIPIGTAYAVWTGWKAPRSRSRGPSRSAVNPAPPQRFSCWAGSSSPSSASRLSAIQGGRHGTA